MKLVVKLTQLDVLFVLKRVLLPVTDYRTNNERLILSYVVRPLPSSTELICVRFPSRPAFHKVASLSPLLTANKCPLTLQLTHRRIEPTEGESVS
jgi:hypothetical protein